MRKSTFSICEIKDTDQLHGNRTAQLIRYIDSTIPVLAKSEISSLGIFYGRTARFVSDLV